mmetsp:Transcript_10585/g.20443  ORF Transcript_10585/g.20443 Transcript_10585/m.20443 type:complete len:470 (-) Transcript_10585:482-1891(-)
MHRPVVELHLVGGIRHVRKRVLHPLLVIAGLVVVACVGAAALSARLSRVHCLRALHEQILKLERLHQVRVPDHGLVGDLDVLDAGADVVDLGAPLGEQVLHTEDGGVRLHHLLQLVADRGGRLRALIGAQKINVGDGLLARALGQVLERIAWLGDLADAEGGGAAEDDDVEQRVGAQAVGAVHRRARGLARGEKAADDGVRVGGRRPDHLSVAVGGDAAHVVVDGGQHGDWLLGHVDAGEDGRRLRDAWQALGKHLWRQVVEVEVDVVLVGAAAAPFVDLHGHRAGDDVARREVLGRRRVALHEALALRVAQDAALAARALGDQAARAVDARRVELHKLEVLERQSGARDHGVAVAGARVCRRGRPPGAAVAARRNDRVLALEAMQAAVLHAESHDADAVARIVHDQVEREVLDEKLRIMAHSLAVERVQHRMACAVGGASAAVCLTALAVVQRLPSKGTLVDLALVCA